MTSPFRLKAVAAATTAAVLLLWAGTASAHLPGLPAGAAPGFFAGFAHPLSGADHVLATAAVGVLAAARGGARLWLYPAVFLAAMIAGFAAAAAGVGLPWVEFGVAGSIVALGFAVALAGRMPVPASLALIALCAILHGHAHGGEAMNLASPAVYAGGFALATVLLHAAGIGAGTALRRLRMMPAAGYGLAATGALIVAGL